jgi:thiamine biosynthesis lipoprotein
MHCAARYIVILILGVFVSCADKKPEFERISGFTQGTTYSIVLEKKHNQPFSEVSRRVEDLLEKIDNSLSVYNDSSVISRINSNETLEADPFLAEVFLLSEEMSELTGGAFDITVKPLVRAWGFGPDETKAFRKEKLDSLLSLVGYQKVKLEDGKIVKSDSRITLDVNAIAQGFTVDLISSELRGLGFKNFLVEVGGEVRAVGLKGSHPWRVGIDKPQEGNLIPGEYLQAVVELSDKSLATSGNYRKFYVEDGVRYSHTIDPITGYPARNRLLSASVICDECTTADALATAFMVRGHEWAINFIAGNPEINAYLVYSGDKGEYLTWISDGLRKILSEQ